MELLVFSDSHRINITDMAAIIEEEQPDAVLHLGDLVRDAEELRLLCPKTTIYNVRGNNDWNSDADEQLIVRAEQVRIYMVHGHQHGVRRDTARLCAAAKKNRCTVALYGHTHEADIHKEDGILVANPGSISMPYCGAPSYLRLTVHGSQVQPELVTL